MSLKVNEPIVISAHCWTKERIHEQLDFVSFEADDIPDYLAIEWAVKEHDLRDEFDTEEAYLCERDALNLSLIQAVDRELSNS